MDIAKELKRRFLDEWQESNEISVFLCGGSTEEQSGFRKRLGGKISQLASKYKYSVYYPEDMFVELILGHQRKDLLSLENLLADAVNAVVILLQSPGTFAELGAFANYEKLKNKLVVVTDPRYAAKRSFINLGPVRYLRASTRSRVLFLPMNDSNIDTLVKQVADAAREIAKHSSPERSLSNPICSYRFYLALVHVFDPLPKDAVLALSRALAPGQETSAATSAEAVINMLINERRVSLTSRNHLTTSTALDGLVHGSRRKKTVRDMLSSLTDLRLLALNLTLRRSYNRVWGEAGES